MSEPADRELVVRPMQADDTPWIHELHTACLRELCAEDYSPEQIEGWLASRTPQGYVDMVETHGERMVVATLGDVVVGFASWKDTGLCSLYVDPAHNAKGSAARSTRLARMTHTRWAGASSELTAPSPGGLYEILGYRLTRRTVHRNGSARIPALVMHRRKASTSSD